MKRFPHTNQRNESAGKWLMTLVFTLGTGALFAQEPARELPKFHDSMYSNPTFIGLMIAAIFMMIMIIALNEILKSILYHKREVLKDKKSMGSNNNKILSITALLLFIPVLSQAQEAIVPAEALPVFPTEWYGLSGMVFWSLILFIAFEVIVALFILGQIRTLLKKSVVVDESVVEEVVPSLFDRLNASVSIEKEKDILLDHDYDGIKELNNDLPPWWKYGFYFTIFSAVVYLFNYHIFKTGNLQVAEYIAENTAAEKQIEEYKKHAANLVDESNVTQLTDESSVGEGKTIFMKNCVACHGNAGEGTTIAPNLTDDYWLHGGNIKDVFYSIKYGWVEKGMRSWQDELNPHQIQVVASFVKSLRGTNPPNAKEKQGTLYVEEGETPVEEVVNTDSTTVVTDSIPVNEK